ncbi:MAG TPA: MgtC/SapB family protein [Vulgatibacter sp.]|nr:MgtC/SapB family protein [Vulgatibacter sp.]
MTPEDHPLLDHALRLVLAALLALPVGWEPGPHRSAVGLAGIGFVGTGAILKSSETSRGITKAVRPWVTGAIGAAAGLGATLLAVSLSVLSAAAVAAQALLGRWRETR